MTKAVIKFEGRYLKQLRARYEGQTLEVGILQDKPHKRVRYPARYGTYEGGPVRRTSAVNSRHMLSDISAKWNRRFDVYRKPFRGFFRSKELKKFLDAYSKYVSKRGSKKDAQDRLAAVVRMPIIKKKYGRNSSSWARTKGFNRLMVDTGQFLRGIKARITGRKRVP